MSEQTSQEPTMEEILASIRRIISEDDAAEAVAAEAAATKAAAAAAAQSAEAEAEDAEAEDEAEDAEAGEEPLELTQKVETHGDLDVLAPAAEPLRPSVVDVGTDIDVGPEPGLVSDRAASVAASAFGQLSAAIGMPRSDRTLEDVVREMLTPLLQQWLDANLPRIVQEAVDAEVTRIARGRVR